MSKTILHTVNKSPFSHSALKECLSVYTNGDAILLLENGVYAALDNHLLSDALKLKSCYALTDDINARGLDSESLADNIKLINYEQFVQLTVEHDMVQSWY